MLQNYTFYQGGILRLHFQNNYADIELSKNFGKIVWRYKLGGTIQHTGIELGYCMNSGEMYYIHNHPRQGQASIVSATEFARGQAIYYENIPCVNTPLQVAQAGLNSVIEQIPYRVTRSNCQNLTNGACQNVSYSQDLNKYVGVAAAFLGFCALFGIGAAALK